jgi:hypothetical protein
VLTQNLLLTETRASCGLSPSNWRPTRRGEQFRELTGEEPPMFATIVVDAKVKAEK